MKKLACLILLVGCTTPGVDNGVSSDGYRKSIGRAEQSIAAVVSRMQTAQKVDRSDRWWQAQLDDLGATRDQLHDALLGASR